jgi:hypothetical protein
VGTVNKITRHFIPSAQAVYAELKQLAPDIQVVLPDADGNPRREPNDGEIPKPMAIAFLTPEEAFIFYVDENARQGLIEALTGGIVIADATQIPPPGNGAAA